MKPKYIRLADELTNKCITQLNMLHMASKWDIISDSWEGFWLDETEEYDAIAYVNGIWELTIGRYTTSIYHIPLQTLCNYIDQIVARYKNK